MSKLAALAAKRRQKENANLPTPEKTTENEPKDEYAASLSKLSLGSDSSRRRNIKDKDDDVLMKTSSIGEVEKDSSQEAAEPENTKNPEDEPIVERVHPSAFAGIFSNKDVATTSSIDPNLLKNTAPAFDFNDPSPDDIVYKAQTGRTR
ncbi:hypothetical protein ES702_00500 [subsurface metagenome]